MVARSSWGDTRDLVATFTKTVLHCCWEFKKASSTLVLNQRGAQTSSPRVELRSPLPEVGFELGYDNAHQEEVDANI